MIQPSASSGQTSCSSSVMKSMNSPIVSVPAITSRPPRKSTAAIPSVGQEEQAGEEVRLDRRLRASSRGAPPRPGRGSACGRPSSRPNACTISIPTTASSVASVRWPFFAWTSREIGKSRCAKNQVRTAIAGIASAEKSASRAFTVRSTIAAATIIIALWIPWTTPQPMK